MFKVFIGGPIQYMLESEDAKSKMKSLIAKLSEYVEQSAGVVLNAHTVEEFGDKLALWDVKSIAWRDYNWMCECDIFIALFASDSYGHVLRSDGTHIEFGWATAMNKPAVMVTESLTFAPASDLLKGLIEENRIKHITFEQLFSRKNVFTHFFEKSTKELV